MRARTRSLTAGERQLGRDANKARLRVSETHPQPHRYGASSAPSLPAAQPSLHPGPQEVPAALLGGGGHSALLLHLCDVTRTQGTRLDTRQGRFVLLSPKHLPDTKRRPRLQTASPSTGGETAGLKPGLSANAGSGQIMKSENWLPA